MINETELREVLASAADDISEFEGNPRTWLSWVVFILARLEEKATFEEGIANRDMYVEMLSALQDEIRSRVRTGGWH